MKNIGKAPLRKELILLMQSKKKLTLWASQAFQTDANAFFEAEWDEQSFHKAICVCARFSLINCITLGHGLLVDEDRRANDARKMHYA